MKRIPAIALSLLLIISVFGGCVERRNSSAPAEKSTPEIISSDLPEATNLPEAQDLPDVQDRDDFSAAYYAPDYGSRDSTDTELFTTVLKRDGYYRNGEIDRSYNTDLISSVVNITPESIVNETNDLAVFLVKDGYHCFLMKDQKIYRYEPFGGNHLQLCLWDYDGNGIRDLVSYHTFGSGVPYLGVTILDLSSMEEHSVLTKNLLVSHGFSFEYKNGVIYIDGEELTYSDGRFHCNSFMSGTNE